MTTPAPLPTLFSRDDLPALAQAHAVMEDWNRFLLTRFAAYTRYTDVTPMGGGSVVEPIEDPFARTSAGYGQYVLGSNWVKNLLDSGEHAAVTVEHHLSDDRGGGATVRKYRLPLDYVFGDAEHQERYEQYLRLKAEFEPDAPSDAASDDAAEPVDPADPDGRYAAATDLINMLPEADRPPALALLDATLPHGDEVYDAVLAQASQAATADERDALYARIDALAAILGLPRRSAGSPNPRRVEAARVLAVQSRKTHEPEPTATQIEELARPENRDKALLAYDTAITSLMRHPGGLSDIRGQVYEAALTLGLDTSSQSIAAARAAQGK